MPSLALGAEGLGSILGVGPIARLPSRAIPVQSHCSPQRAPSCLQPGAPIFPAQHGGLGSGTAGGTLPPGAPGWNRGLPRTRDGVKTVDTDSAGLGSPRDGRATLHRCHSMCTAGAAGVKSDTQTAPACHLHHQDLLESSKPGAWP